MANNLPAATPEQMAAYLVDGFWANKDLFPSGTNWLIDMALAANTGWRAFNFNNSDRAEFKDNRLDIVIHHSWDYEPWLKSTMVDTGAYFEDLLGVDINVFDKEEIRPSDMDLEVFFSGDEPESYYFQRLVSFPVQWLNEYVAMLTGGALENAGDVIYDAIELGSLFIDIEVEAVFAALDAVAGIEGETINKIKTVISSILNPAYVSQNALSILTEAVDGSYSMWDLTWEHNPLGTVDSFHYQAQPYIALSENLGDDSVIENTGSYTSLIETSMHEFMHVLGLGHLGNYNGSIDHIIQTTDQRSELLDEYGNYAANYNEFINDSKRYSLMSYIDSDENPEVDFKVNYVVTPMEADFIALSQLYALSPTVQQGDTVWGFNSNHTVDYIRRMYSESIYIDASGNTGWYTPGHAIYDTGGSDTWDLTGSPTVSEINLEPGSYSSILSGTNNVFIAPISEIETLKATNYTDIITTATAFKNVVYGNGGDDTVHAFSGDEIHGGDNNDYIVFSSSTTSLTGAIAYGDEGNDTIEASSGTGDITVHSGTGSDTIKTAEGNDEIYVSDSAHVIAGDGDNLIIIDRITPNATIELIGGIDTDILEFSAASNHPTSPGINIYAKTSNTFASNETVPSAANSATIILSDFEKLKLTTEADNITIQNGSQLSGLREIHLNSGDDTIHYNGNPTRIFGEDGSDSIGTEVFTNIYGGSVTDDNNQSPNDANEALDEAKFFISTSQLTSLYVDLSSNTYKEDQGNNYTIQGFEIIDFAASNNYQVFLTGSSISEDITGGAESDFLDGGSGDDSLDGGQGADTLRAGEGNDSVLGSGGNDIFIDDSGTDFYDGGSGVDLIRFYGKTQYEIDLNISKVVRHASDENESIYNIENVEIEGSETNPAISSGDDTVRGSLAANDIWTSEGNDLLVGRGGDDTLRGGEGNDTLQGGEGNDVLVGGDGKDLVDYSGEYGVDLDLQRTINQATTTRGDIDQIEGIECVIGSDYDDIILGDYSNNIIEGGDGNDFLGGRYGDDKVLGGDGDDTLSYSSGQDTLDGGSGLNFICFDSNGPIYFSLEDSGLTQEQAIQAPGLNGENPALVINIQGISGGIYNDTLIGNHEDNLLHGNDGDDTLEGRRGNDRLLGGIGNDTIYETSDSGNDTYDGGSGRDTIDFTAASHGVTVRLDLGTAISSDLNAGSGSDTLTAIENVIGTADIDRIAGDDAANLLEGRDGNDILAGGDGKDTLLGGNGDDLLAGQDEASANLYDGGAGYDTISYVGATTDTTINLATGKIINSGVISTIRAIEAADGGKGNDTLVGNDNDNVLRGDEGNDIIRSNSGADTLIGGTGDDTLSLYEAIQSADTIVMAKGHGNDTVYGFGLLGLTATTLATSDRLDLSQFYDPSGNQLSLEDMTLSFDNNGNLLVRFYDGSSLTFVFEGNGLRLMETLQVTSGDQIKGAAAAEVATMLGIIIPTCNGIISGTSGSDLIDANYTSDSQGDRIDNADAYLSSQGDWIEAGDGNDTISSGYGNDTVVASLGEDTVNLGSYDDWVIESDGTGNDTYDGGSGTDVIDYRSLTSQIDINLASGHVITGSGIDQITAFEWVYGTNFNDTIFGTDTGNETLIAGNGNDSIAGGGGKDSIDGGLGNDTLDGGMNDDIMTGKGGDDVYYVRDARDIVIESGSEGYDTVYSYLNRYALTDHVENGWIVANVAASITGNSSANFLRGNTGHDTIDGGAGSDTMIGGGGKDIFDFNALSDMGTTRLTWDVISDFVRGQDKIDLSSLDANTATDADDAFVGRLLAPAANFTKAGQLKLVSGVLYGNTDLDATAEFAIQLNGVAKLSANDFIL